MPLAVLEEVRVAVLVAGARDERRALARECLRPVERLRHVRDRVAVDDVVAGVAAGAEDDRVREVGRRGGELGRDDVRRVVGRQRVVGAEVAGEEDQVVPAGAEQLPAQVGSPSTDCDRERHRVGRRNALVGDQRGVRPRRADAGAEFVCDRRRRRPAGSRSPSRATTSESARRPPSCRGVGVEQAADLGGRLDETADGEVGDRERRCRAA